LDSVDDGESWPHYQSVGQASGGVYTTASDLARFVAAIADNDLNAPGRGVLKPNTVRQMIVPAEGTDGSYGLGYKMFPVSSEVQLVTHDGSNEGWRAMFMMHPRKGDGVVVLANSDLGGKVVADIACALFARTEVDMTPLCSTLRR
jgi:CubicO group peptidase (beta-lactamase class C family)